MGRIRRGLVLPTLGGSQEIQEPLSQLVLVLRLAFPNDEDPPAYSTQSRLVRLIPRDVLVEFVSPERHARRGLGSLAAVDMAMPETPVNEDHGLSTRKHDVRRPRQITSMQPKSISEAMNDTSHDQLGRRVLRADAGHQS